MNIDFHDAEWMFEPKKHSIQMNKVTITTEPLTDIWQRSFYGFKNNNAPRLLLESSENFSFTAKIRINYKKQFDQCGLLIYLDSDNWFKASIEFENEEFSRLGSVVTNLGYSDWATTDILLPEFIWYRLNRRGPDFLIESSTNGKSFKQMRIFHLYKLGETTPEMGNAYLPLPTEQPIHFGIYACSPLMSSYIAEFSDFKLEPCQWLAYDED